MKESRTFRQYGRLLQSWRNECKLTVDQVAKDCAMSADELRDLERGRAKPTWDHLERLAGRYCVSVRELLPRDDDRERGVKIMRDRDAARIEQLRAGRLQYTYIPRASSTTLPDFRPVELVLQLTDREGVVLNKGHFFHQYTQVLEGGPVGFLWQWEGQVQHEILEPGDSWLIPGFVPHGFYSADSNQIGRILAVTFGCHLTGDAREELVLLGASELFRIVQPDDYYQE